MFFKREAKPSYNIYLHARDQERVGVAPPPVTMKSSAPEWWKRCDWSIDEKNLLIDSAMSMTRSFGQAFQRKTSTKSISQQQRDALP